MIGLDQKKLEDVFIKLKLITPEDLNRAKIESVRSGKDLDTVLVSLNILPPEDVVKAKAISIGVPYVDLSGIKVDQSILKNISKELAKKYEAVPFGFSGGTLNVAMTNPNNIQAIEFIEGRSGLRVSPYMASVDSIKIIIDQYQDLSSEVSEALKTVGAEADTEKDKKINAEAVDLSQDAPVTRAVNTILEYAVKSHASDIHIEPWDSALKVRFRVDGILQETMSLPLHIQAALVSRIKILSEMKIDEHRVPQDGRFDINIENHEIDIRVAVSPTVNGEKVVMRLLDKSGGVIDLEKLGIYGRAYAIISAASSQPQGMILSTGPTGSGKTTTLYAILTKINTPSVNIVTLEDPVEYQVGGVNQIQVNASVGLTFASGLRSILRQDPDVIMVGEIRDGETADLAVQSALTGHTVLSTLHTNSASGVLPRLLDMEIEPFLIASTVTTIIGQRLVRVLCPKCKKAYRANPSLNAAIISTVGNDLPKNADEAKKIGYPNLPPFGTTEFILYQPVGCQDCNKTGYSGRVGIYEVITMTSKIEQLIVKRATTSEIQSEAVAEGMITMRQDGFLKALSGFTTVEEVISKAAEV